MQNSVQQSGRHFLQVPGPTPVPERILAAMSRQMMDHRSPQFQELAHQVLSGIRSIFRTNGPVILFPSSGTGALEAALVNTLSPGDCVLFAGTGQFDLLWATAARDLGLMPIVIQTDWRSGADARFRACCEAVAHCCRWGDSAVRAGQNRVEGADPA